MCWNSVARPFYESWSALSQEPNLCVAGAPQNYNVATDASGFFTVTTGLANGSYNWRLKGQLNIANSGSLTLAGNAASIDMGMQRAGDATGDNLVSAQDFSVLKNAFGKQSTDPGYDGRADFNRDGVVNSGDFSLLKGNFGQGGASLTCP